jgi:hypothetical protein
MWRNADVDGIEQSDGSFPHRRIRTTDPKQPVIVVAQWAVLQNRAAIRGNHLLCGPIVDPWKLTRQHSSGDAYGWTAHCSVKCQAFDAAARRSNGNAHVIAFHAFTAGIAADFREYCSSATSLIRAWQKLNTWVVGRVHDENALLRHSEMGGSPTPLRLGDRVDVK